MIQFEIPETLHEYSEWQRWSIINVIFFSLKILISLDRLNIQGHTSVVLVLFEYY